MSFFVDTFSFLLGNHLRVEWLAHGIGACRIANATGFPGVLMPRAIHESFHCPTSSPILRVVGLSTPASLPSVR